MRIPSRDDWPANFHEIAKVHSGPLSRESASISREGPPRRAGTGASGERGGVGRRATDRWPVAPVSVRGGFVRRGNQAMSAKRWFRFGGPVRGTPTVGWSSPRRSVCLVVLALAGIVQSGCQSGPLGRCGKCGFLSGLRSRVFHRPAEECCGPEGGAILGSEVPIDSGVPVLTPAPGGLLPAPAEPGAPQLEAIPSESLPSAIPGPPREPATQGAKSPTSRTNYEAYRPRYRSSQSRSENVARALNSTPSPPPRSARGSDPLPVDAADLLQNIPPLELPKDLSRGEPTSTVPTPASVEADAGGSSSAVEASPPPAEVSVAPGIRRFAVVEPKLAGGSLPMATGLDWLVEKGYRTILDLREAGEIQPSYIAEVTNRGLRYVSLPITLKTLDTVHLDRFHDELALADARPLYFCDTHGDRAGALWYIRRVTVDKVDPQLASGEAEALGLTDKVFWQAASTYLDGLNAPKPETGQPSGVKEKGADPAPGSTSLTMPPSDATPSSLEPALEALNASLAASMHTPGEDIEPGSANPKTIADPTAWRPFAALVLTGLGVPLAYWGRSGFPITGLTKASLPGPGRSPKSLPPASGE